MANNKIRVEVVYALPNSQTVLTAEVEAGSSLQTAVLASGMLAQFPHIDLSQQKVGVFSKLGSLLDTVYDGDRIEIYRTLVIGPKEARARRAKAKKRAVKAEGDQK